jgi:5-methyltetrahydrofolate--homocysteine methyltransferase
MGVLLHRLAEKNVLVSDGAFGTMLQSKGLGAGDCAEEWNLSHPEEVKSVSRAYAEAGSDMVLTNTFGGSRIKLAKAGYGDRVAEFNAAAVRCALEAVPANVVVAGSVGPTGAFLQPYGDLTNPEMEEVFAEQIQAMLDAGLQIVCVETMTAVEEAACAVRVARRLGAELDIVATMTFDPSPAGYKTMMGVDPARAAAVLSEAGADVLGSNCGNGIEQMVPIVAAFREHTDNPLLVHANAGLPELVGGETVFRQSPADMAARVEDVVAAGASIVGGCCGTTPAHISAMKAVIDKLY